MNTLRIHFAPCPAGTSSAQGPAAAPAFEPRVLVDGIDLGEGAGYVFDWLWLVAQGSREGEFDLFTCSCGVPGCAGIHTACRLSAQTGQVIWELPEQAYGALLRPRVLPQGAPLRFVFDEAAYLRALEASIVEFEALQAAHPMLQLGGFIDFDEPLEGEAPVPMRPVRELLQQARDWQAEVATLPCGGTD